MNKKRAKTALFCHFFIIFYFKLNFSRINVIIFYIMFSQIALKIYGAVCDGLITSRNLFWKNFSTEEKVKNLDIDTEKYEQKLKNADFDIVCCFDGNFPKIPETVPEKDKPFFFAYRGDLSLLNEIDNNIAVIGVKEPNEEIAKREKKIVSKIIENGFCIVSGLADGCDTVAHSECVKNSCKTIAFLPSTLNKIYPPKNLELSQKIVECGGLVVSEYVTEPKNHGEGISRFVERDRLQAMFSKAVVLIASYRYGEGDSGSRHAMQKAKIYGKQRFMMFDKQKDFDQAIFGLNQDLLNEDVTILTERSIKDLILN